MAAEGGSIVRFTYTGQENIPDDVTHVTIAVRSVPAEAFRRHPNIIEVICREDVEKIESSAFECCSSLRRVIMPGVKIAEEEAFSCCGALADVECGKLEIIKEAAFQFCRSLKSINLSSVRIIEGGGFDECIALTDVTFGRKLEIIDEVAFGACESMERITIPLKDGIITDDDIFMGCVALKHVDLVEGAVLNESITALQLEDWRNDMNDEIDSINQILPSAPAGRWDDADGGEKAQAIRRWIRTVLRKIIHYQAEHQRLLDEEAATTLQLALPQDIAMNYVLPFLALPSHTFEVGYDGEDSDDDVQSADSFVEE